jgi:predicted amidohydrolase YtcJ
MTTQAHLSAVIRAQAIYSMAPDGSVYRALAIRQDRIHAAAADPAAFDDDVGPQTTVVDLPSLTILPAFFDNHNHLGEASRNNLFVSVGKATSIVEMIELIRQRAARTPPGAWIQTSNDWHQDRFAEHRMPTADDLDAATTNHPVVARRGGHLAVVNSRALKAAGITRDTPDPPGGSLGHTPSGDPDGVLVGGAQYALLRIPTPAPDEQLEHCGQRQRRSLPPASAVCAIHLRAPETCSSTAWRWTAALRQFASARCRWCTRAAR